MDEQKRKFNFFSMFWEGFKNMKLGKILWTIVIIKLIIMFVILRPFFFPNFLSSKFDDDKSKSEYVSQELIDRSITNTDKNTED
ncbi:MAG: DUF4492 domain-containing protein [Dysgonomonas sp.]